MTKSPDDQIEPYETRLTRRVDAFTEQAVRPIDAAAIASAARAGARRQTLLGRLFGSGGSTARLGIIVAGALVGALALGVYIGSGGTVAPGQTANGPSPVPTAGPTPTRMPGLADDCLAAALTGEITAWEGAAGHRIATISLRNTGAGACVVPQQLRLSLFDSTDHQLLYGFGCDCPPFTFGAGASATAMVDMSNFCGTYVPSGTLRIRVHLPDGSSVDLLPGSKVVGPIDPPPCSGPSVPGSISMQPLRLGTVSS